MRLKYEPGLRYANTDLNILGDAEQVDVRVVHGEVKKDNSSASINPTVLLEASYDVGCLRSCGGQVLEVTGAGVLAQSGIVGGTVHLSLRVKYPTTT